MEQLLISQERCFAAQPP